MLAKGPVGPGLAVVILALTLTLTRRWRQVYGPGVALALAALVVVAAPWYLAAEAREPGFLRYFFLAENLERYATERYHHVQPFYFYLLPVLFGFFPWTGHLIALAWRDRRQPLPDTERRAVFFLRVWALTVVLFFSASQTKRVGYHLPWRAWLLMTPLITLADTLPVSLGGLGVRETASVLFLLTLGVEAPSALASSLLWEGVVLLTSLPGGLALLQSSDCADRSAL
jgi:4-amino-4-deoxy-L-arabinose transferase-like glycosyltransferase